MFERVKLKNQPKQTSPAEPVGQILMNNNVNTPIVRTLTKYEREAAENLIRLTFQCHGNPITAVIDTGSEINVVRSAIATERIPLPLDTQNTTMMGDANGGEGYLKGLISTVPLTCGAVKTYCDVFVGDNVPFDLLLGRPWQLRNKVSIDERRAGTYLVFKDDTDNPHYEVRIPPEALLARSNGPVKRKVQTITIIQPPADATLKELNELEQCLEDPDHDLPKDSLIKLSTYDTKWLEDQIDPLSKIVADGKLAEGKEILEKSEQTSLQQEEVSEIQARILAEFPEARWMKKHEEERSNKLKEVKSPQGTDSSTCKIEPQGEPDNSQRQGKHQSNRLTLIDLSGTCQQDDKTGSVIQLPDKSTSDILPEPRDPFQGLSTNLAYLNEPSPPKHSPEPPNMSENHYPPAPPTIAEAYVANQHGQRLLDALPAFSEELVPLSLSTGQARMMGIGLEQDSGNAFAEIVARDAQLNLMVNNEGHLLEGDLYFILWYPHADLRPWNVLVAPQSSTQSMHSSVPSTRISFPDTAPFGNSDQPPANSSSLTTNVPLLGLPLLREPGALETAPALSPTTSPSTTRSNGLEIVSQASQILSPVVESGENVTRDTETQYRAPLPMRQHLLPRRGRALEPPPREPTPVPRFPNKNANFQTRYGDVKAKHDASRPGDSFQYPRTLDVSSQRTSEPTVATRDVSWARKDGRTAGNGSAVSPSSTTSIPVSKLLKYTLETH